MTTVISRLYGSVDTAESVAETLRAEGFPERTLSVITTPDKAAIEAARVAPDAAERYASAMTAGQAVFVCRAPFTPFGAARFARDTADREPAIDAGVDDENRYIEEVADLSRFRTQVLSYHPLMMTRDDYVGSGWADWRVSDVFGFTLISRRKERPDNLIEGHMSKAFWPGKLLSTRKRRLSVFRGGRHMSRGWWPMPLTTRKSSGRRLSILKSHPRITERLGFRTLSTQR